MINSYDDLSPVQLDVLKEIGNIGSGNAATALSQLLGRSIDMQVPQVRLMDVADAIESLGSPDKLVVGILIRLKGDADGMIMFLLEEAFAKTIVTGIMGERSFSLYEMIADDISVLSEIGNIMGGSYAIANLSGMVIDMSVPALTTDMLGAIMTVPATELSEAYERVLMISEQFLIDSVEIQSDMLLIPTVESLRTLLGKLGVEDQ